MAEAVAHQQVSLPGEPVTRKLLSLGSGGSAIDPATLATSAAGGACSIVLTPPAGRRVVLAFILAGYTATPAAGLLTISSNTRSTLRRVPITAAGPAPLELPNWEGLADEVITIALAAGGGAVVGYLNVDASVR